MLRPVLLMFSSLWRRACVALVVLAGGLLVVSTAHAAAVSFSGTDPKGDNKSVTGHDFVAISGEYDAETGSFSVTAETAAPFLGGEGAMTFLVGTAVNGVCALPDENTPAESLPPFMQFYLLNPAEGPPTVLFAYTTKEIQDTAQLKPSGNQVTLTSPANPALANLPLDCLAAAIGYNANGEGLIADQAMVLAGTPGAPAPPGSTPPAGAETRPPLKVATTEPDGDRDGNPDTSDVCPKAPGALANGCPAVMPASELKLGAKRVVVDRLVARTGAACPAQVTITVTSRGKTIGKGTFTVDEHGAFCRVKGIVRLKVRKTKVRVIAKATGMGGTARTVKR